MRGGFVLFSGDGRSVRITTLSLRELRMSVADSLDLRYHERARIELCWALAIGLMADGGGVETTPAAYDWLHDWLRAEVGCERAVSRYTLPDDTGVWQSLRALLRRMEAKCPC